MVDHGREDQNGSITGAKIVDGSLTSRDLKPGTLPAAGAVGATGPQGPQGVSGPKGDPGAKGDQGNPGTSALGPLPSGRTLVGGGLLSQTATAAGLTIRNYENFPVHLAQPISEVNPRQMFFGTNTDIAASNYASGEQNPRCDGSPAAPTAPAGLLCVYVGDASNLSALSVRAGYVGIGDTVANDDGFYIFGTSAATGDTLVRYTWAYTAP